MLTVEQNRVCDAIVSRVNVLITGPGGVGKSTIIKRVVTLDDIETGITATTGAAAILIGGKTLHSYLGIGLAKEDVYNLIPKIKPDAVKVWRNTQRLVIDEISMMSAELLDKLDAVAKIIRKCTDPFGGIQVVLSGDFLQLPCISGKFAFEADCWSNLNLTIFHLTKIQRQVDVAFQECLNRARFGLVTDSDVEYITSVNDLVPNAGLLPTKILCMNVDVDEINAAQLAKLTSIETFTYKLEIEPTSAIGKFKISQHCNATESLVLAVGAQVMLLVNMKTLNLVNGSRGVVVDFEDDLPVVRFRNCVITVHYHGWEVYERKNRVATVYQIPLKLAWAITIHKSQGATIDCATVDLNGVFEFGQAYVALSRVVSKQALIVKNATRMSFRAHPKAIKFYETLKNGC
jgi:ATP-dependent DNA helicase PIF1